MPNPYGDLELTEPRAMRALSHPVRLAILSRLQGSGPATATELAKHVGASPSVTSWHLRHLAEFGLVRDSAQGADGGTDRRKRYWEAAARGFRFEFPDDEEGRAASQVLSSTMFEQYADLPRHWMTEVQPALEPQWRRASGLSNTGVRLTSEELEHVNAELERVLAPYVTRDEAPEGARVVRLLRYVLPEAEQA